MIYTNVIQSPQEQTATEPQILLSMHSIVCIEYLHDIYQCDSISVKFQVHSMMAVLSEVLPISKEEVKYARTAASTGLLSTLIWIAHVCNYSFIC
jgi:hypothetical protein